jgi:hypothetical protein
VNWIHEDPVTKSKRATDINGTVVSAVELGDVSTNAYIHTTTVLLITESRTSSARFSAEYESSRIAIVVFGGSHNLHRNSK